MDGVVEEVTHDGKVLGSNPIGHIAREKMCDLSYF